MYGISVGLSIDEVHETRKGGTRKEKDVKEVNGAIEHMWYENETSGMDTYFFSLTEKK